MKQAIKELHQGKNKEKNIDIFTVGMRELYQKYSYVQLAMLQYVYYECCLEQENISDSQHWFDGVNDLVRQNILTGNPSESNQRALEQIKELRGKVIERMEEITSYIDAFSLYEHILNRVEYRFREQGAVAIDNDQELTRTVMRYIVSQEDNGAINSKISQVIGQLPVRMTKGKFHQLLEEGMDVYATADRKSFEDFLYRLYTSTAIHFTLCDKPYLEKATDLYKVLKKLDYSNLTGEEYRMARDSLTIATQVLRTQAEQCISLQEIINHVYVILLGEPARQESREILDSLAVLAMIDKKWQKEQREEFDREEEALLISLEGYQEALYESFMKYDYVTDELLQDELVLEEKSLYNKVELLTHIRDLISDSLFVEWGEYKEQDMSTEYFANRKQKTLLDFDKYFGEHTKWENRAVMAAALSEIPVFFNQLTQVQDYIYRSLHNCGDLAEKQAVVELLQAFSV